MSEDQAKELLRTLDRIANALEAVANCCDQNSKLIGVEALTTAARG